MIMIMIMIMIIIIIIDPLPSIKAFIPEKRWGEWIG